MIWKAPKIKPSRNLIASTSPAPPCVAVCRTGNAGGLECVRLLAQAGANVNAHDNEGNTPLHETFLTDVEEELLKLGEDVNARNELTATLIRARLVVQVHPGPPSKPVNMRRFTLSLIWGIVIKTNFAPSSTGAGSVMPADSQPSPTLER